MRWTVIGMGAALGMAGVLAGCSSGQTGSNSSSRGGAMTGGGQDQPTPSNLQDDPQNAVEPVALPSPQAITSIPAGFRGRWGMVVTDCLAKGGQSNGLMVVSGSGITFHDSRATVGSLARIGTDTITAELSYSGRGQAGRRADRLTLVDDGRTLVRQEQQAATLFRYSRCPA